MLTNGYKYRLDSNVAKDIMKCRYRMDTMLKEGYKC